MQTGPIRMYADLFGRPDRVHPARPASLSAGPIADPGTAPRPPPTRRYHPTRPRATLPCGGRHVGH
ncbi:hypothetical protein ACFSUD_12550 [Sulfitobacter aestuarii]|uniref:Uncharacterized protein n=1 Tax=Sulfitobacter aestuarii TaxID=2161676 RepID=A0ABW5U662_9RHOB